MKFNKLLSYTLAMLLAVYFVACSDNGSSGTDEEPPSVPELSKKAQPDVSFFQDNNPTVAAGNEFSNATVQNFNTAKGTVLGGAALLSINQVYIGFINPASQEQADFVDGQWVWEYSTASGGQSFGIRTTARPQGDGFEWAIFVSGNDGQGNSITDFKIMEGTTSNGGAQGNWTFFFFNDETSSMPFLTSSWTVVSETESSIDLEIFDEDGATTAIITYQKIGVENLMTIDFYDEEGPAEVFWNTETNIGYIMQGSEKSCWNGSFQNTSCSGVGL